MLPRRHRLTDRAGFTATVRSGRRAGTRTLVVHLLVPAGTVGAGADSGPGAGPAAGGPPRVGLVVGRSVGPSVVRSTVSRRLRHLARERLALLPEGSSLVLRALPPSAGAPSSELGADLDRGLSRVLATVAA